MSFGKGQSAVHRAAYNARCSLKDERSDRQTRDYGELGETLFSGIFVPKNAPTWARDREQLWNRAEAAERQKMNGQPARNIEFAFPHELDQRQREWLLKDFVREQFVRAGMIADASIHAPHPDGDQRNFHAHVLVTMRKLDGDGFARTKNREWNSKAILNQWRERWAEMGARSLDRNGFTVEASRWRHGHQTLPEQRQAALDRGDHEFAATLDREPTTHRGPYVDAMTRKGIETDRASVFEDTQRDNAELAALKAELAEIQAQIAAERELSIEINEAAIAGPAAFVGEAVRAGMHKTVENLAGVAHKAREALFGPVPATDQAKEKLDWRRYIADRDYRRQVDAQKHDRDKEPDRGPNLER